MPRPVRWRLGFLPSASPIFFVDHQSIAGGDRWRDELRASAGACRVVVCLVTQSWLDSHECYAEFRAISGYWGKRTIPLFLLPPTNCPCTFVEITALDIPKLPYALQERINELGGAPLRAQSQPCNEGAL